MERVSYSQKSKQDLLDIWLYIAADSPNSADKLLADIENRLFILAKNPRIGHQRNDVSGDALCFPHKKYLILYRQQDGGIEVVRVVHGMRDIKNISF